MCPLNTEYKRLCIDLNWADVYTMLGYEGFTEHQDRPTQHAMSTPSSMHAFFFPCEQPLMIGPEEGLDQMEAC